MDFQVCITTEWTINQACSASRCTKRGSREERVLSVRLVFLPSSWLLCHPPPPTLHAVLRCPSFQRTEPPLCLSYTFLADLRRLRRKSFISIFLLTLSWMSQKLTHLDSGRAVVWLLSSDKVSHPRTFYSNSSSLSHHRILLLWSVKAYRTVRECLYFLSLSLCKKLPILASGSIEFPQWEKAIKLHSPHLDNITAAVHNGSLSQ